MPPHQSEGQCPTWRSQGIPAYEGKPTRGRSGVLTANEPTVTEQLTVTVFVMPIVIRFNVYPN